METFYKDAFEEGQRANQMIDSDDRMVIAFEILRSTQQGYEQFSFDILLFYNRYNCAVPELMKDVCQENMMQFGVCFTLGLLYYETCGKGALLWN